MNQVPQTDTNTCNGCRNCGAGCTCGRMHGYNGHPLLRILLALVILGFVFSAGIRLGELKAELTMGYEHQMTAHHGDYGMGMMQQGQNTMSLVVPAVPVTPTTTATPAAR